MFIISIFLLLYGVFTGLKKVIEIYINEPKLQNIHHKYLFVCIVFILQQHTCLPETKLLCTQLDVIKGTFNEN
jgi:hypothetical protein